MSLEFQLYINLLNPVRHGSLTGRLLAFELETGVNDILNLCILLPLCSPPPLLISDKQISSGTRADVIMVFLVYVRRVITDEQR